MATSLHLRDYLVATSLALVVLAYGFGLMVPGVCGVFHDDAIYVATAKALATGQGYRLINLPDSPPQTKYPILYPALLALIWKIWPSFPENLVIMQILNLVLGALAVGLGYLYLVRWSYASPVAAGAAGLLTAVSPWFLYFCGLTMSEMFFALATVIAAWALESYLQEDQPHLGQHIGLGIILALPGLIRLLGLVFVPLGLWLIWRQKKPFLAVAAPCLMILLIMAGWMLLGRPKPEVEVLSYYHDYWGWWLKCSSLIWPRILIYNLIFTISSIFGLLNPNFFQLQELTRYFWLPAILGGTAILVVLGLQTARQRVLPILLIGYLTVILFWPWPPIRFLIPLLIFFLALPLELLRQALKRQVFFIPGAIAAGLVTIVLVTNTYFSWQISRMNSRSGYPLPQRQNEKAVEVSWTDFRDLFAWITSHTATDEIIASNFDTMIFLYTGRQGFRPYFDDPKVLFYRVPGASFASSAAMAQVLIAKKTRYLVQTPMPLYAAADYWQNLVEQLQQSYPHWLQLVYTGKDPRFKVFALRPGQKLDHD